jgi:hypothetical protein
MKVLIATLFALILASGARADDALHAPWGALLREHVAWTAEGTASTVDYHGFARDRAALTAYLDALGAVPPARYEAWPKAQRQAFLINAYNAQTVALILTRWPEIESIKELGGLFSSPWKQRYFDLLGARRSLDEVEHELLRGAPDFDEPRIHFAVNCASIGCPALRPEAYTGAALDAQLDDQTRRFLRDRSRNRYDPASGVLTVSKIFDWYAEDFERGLRGTLSVADFLGEYAGELAELSEARGRIGRGAVDLAYSDYDWALNAAPVSERSH